MTALDHADFEWKGGGLASLLALQGDAAVLVSTVPSPPGSRIEGTLLEEPRDSVRIKVHVCRSVGDGTYRIEGRTLDLRREIKARLEEMARERSVRSGSTDGGGVVPRP
jgi:hypothetical protein